MPLPKIQDARNLSDQDLANEILAVKRQLFDLRLQQATRRLDKPHQFKHAKHKLGQLLTVERERERAAKTEKSADAPKPEAQDEE